MESYADYSNRIGSGRAYARNGFVLDLQIDAGRVSAIVAGSAFSTEMIEGSGDVGRAALAGAVEFGAEALSGKLVNAATAKIANL